MYGMPEWVFVLKTERGSMGMTEVVTTFGESLEEFTHRHGGRIGVYALIEQGELNVDVNVSIKKDE